MATNAFKCSNGCNGSCIADYTCDGKCKEGYESDGRDCFYCQIKPFDSPSGYLQNDSYCLYSDNFLIHNHWLPNEGIKEIYLNDENELIFDLDTPISQSFFHYKQKNRMGRWFKFNRTLINNGFINIVLTKQSFTSFDLFMDMTNTYPTKGFALTYAHLLLKGNEKKGSLKVPNEPVLNPDYPFSYLFISIDNYHEFTVQLKIEIDSTYVIIPYFELSQQVLDEMKQNISSVKTIKFPIAEQGLYRYSIGADSMLLNMVTFVVSFKGEYSLRVNTKKQNRVLYFVEFRFVDDGNGVFNPVTDGFWVGKSYGILSKPGVNNGLTIRIKEDKHKETRYFSVMTGEHGISVDVDFQIICPNDCNNHGVCSTKQGKCVCMDGYGGDDCHLKCYHNNTWQVADISNLCYFGSDHCDQHCTCENGYQLINHYCSSDECAYGSVSENDECFKGSEGCIINCQCEENYIKTNETKCKPKLCGNNQKDDIYSFNGKFIRTEECDGGVNCDMFCYCIEGFKPNPEDGLSCVKKGLKPYEIVLVCVGSILGFIIVLVIIVITIYVIRSKKVDINVFKQQQPNYYYYINGASLIKFGEELKFNIDPIELDFGMRESLIEIKETRYHSVELKNYSRNKYMMAIFHTPNNPKYVFHFDPQVVFLRPTLKKKVMCYITLHCTTKIRDMKIPYTVWFSKSKSTLESIAELLKGKTFDLWGDEEQKIINKYNKGVLKRYYSYLLIKTDAISSTYIDMDEIQMAEKPIAEGAMGKVFFGSYRSVPVAIKQFRWENLTPQEMNELKQEVINESEIMKKLRNPFIANYMGSVTYVPQVSMVIQFFVLGSLGEYLRIDREDYVKLPYRLKVKMLYDTARGMQFLHENRIMHLDLKPDNLLVNSLYTDSACCIKITDFGTSRFTKKTNKLGDKGLGTPIYVSPEAYHDEYTFAGDVYSFAVTAWEIFYQQEPYEEFKSIFEIKEYVESGKRLGFDDSIPKLYRELVQDCWKQNPIERPTFGQIGKGLIQIQMDSQIRNDLDNGVHVSEIEELIQKRTKKLKDVLSEICVE